MNLYVVLFVISLGNALMAVYLEAVENRKLRKELRAERAKNSQRWDWTKEQEQKAQEVMELVCDKCHEPFRGWSQDELDIACARCKVPEAVYRLAAGPRKTPPSPQQAAATPPLAGEAKYGGGKREEARR